MWAWFSNKHLPNLDALVFEGAPTTVRVPHCVACFAITVALTLVKLESIDLEMDLDKMY